MTRHNKAKIKGYIIIYGKCNYDELTLYNYFHGN